MWAKARSIQGKMQNAGARLLPLGNCPLSGSPTAQFPRLPTPDSRSFSPGPACVPCLLGSIHGKCCKYVLKYAFIHTNMARRRLRQPQKASASAVESSWSRSRQNNKSKLWMLQLNWLSNVEHPIIMHTFHLLILNESNERIANF